MTNDNSGPRKPVINNKLFAALLLAVAVFMFGSIIYKYIIGF